MRPWVLGQIGEEAAAGEAGRITIKVNGLTDPEVIDALYAASQAGVRIDLSVRGVCCLRPGVPGLSETDHGALDHGALFGALPHLPFRRPGRRSAPVRYTIGSGDLMERNLDRRIEVLVPVLDPELQARLEETIAAQSRRRHQRLGAGAGRVLEAGRAGAGPERPAAPAGARRRARPQAPLPRTAELSSGRADRRAGSREQLVPSAGGRNSARRELCPAREGEGDAAPRRRRRRQGRAHRRGDRGRRSNVRRLQGRSRRPTSRRDRRLRLPRRCDRRPTGRRPRSGSRGDRCPRSRSSAASGRPSSSSKQSGRACSSTQARRCVPISAAAASSCRWATGFGLSYATSLHLGVGRLTAEYLRRTRRPGRTAGG